MSVILIINWSLLGTGNKSIAFLPAYACCLTISDSMEPLHLLGPAKIHSRSLRSVIINLYMLLCCLCKLRVFSDPLLPEQNSGELYFFRGEYAFWGEFQFLSNINISRNKLV
jgi:hypothetical protein